MLPSSALGVWFSVRRAHHDRYDVDMVETKCVGLMVKSLAKEYSAEFGHEFLLPIRGEPTTSDLLERASIRRVRR